MRDPPPISSQPISVYTSHLENLMQKHLRHLQKIIMACVCSQSGSVIFNISSRVQPTWRKFIWWSPLVWKQLLPQRGLEYSAAHCNVLPRIHHNLTPHYKGSIKGCAKYCESWKFTQHYMFFSFYRIVAKFMLTRKGTQSCPRHFPRTQHIRPEDEVAFSLFHTTSARQKKDRKSKCNASALQKIPGTNILKQLFMQGCYLQRKTIQYTDCSFVRKIQEPSATPDSAEWH